MSTALYVVGNMTGANGDITRHEAAEKIARELGDYVHECLAEDGWPYDGRLIEKVDRMIAYRMIEQWEYDAEMWNRVLAKSDIERIVEDTLRE